MMHRYEFIIAYDIADKKRVQKIGRLVEKHAIRIQYSVYLYSNSTKQEVIELIKKLEKIYNKDKDDIRVYKIKNSGLHLGSAIDLDKPFDFFELQS